MIKELHIEHRLEPTIETYLSSKSRPVLSRYGTLYAASSLVAFAADSAFAAAGPLPFPSKFIRDLLL
jgi:hypothetical protein